MYNLGMWEMIIIMIVVILLFGAKRLPEVGKSLGTGIKEFKKSLTMSSDEEETKESSKIEESTNSSKS